MVRKQSPARSPRPRDNLRNKQKLSSLSLSLSPEILKTLKHKTSLILCFIHISQITPLLLGMFSMFFFCSRNTILNLIVLDLLYPLFVYVDFEFHCWNNSIPLRFLIIIANQSQNLVQFSYYCTFLDVYRKYIYITALT